MTESKIMKHRKYGNSINCPLWYSVFHKNHEHRRTKLVWFFPTTTKNSIFNQSFVLTRKNILSISLGVGLDENSSNVNETTVLRPKFTSSYKKRMYWYWQAKGSLTYIVFPNAEWNIVLIKNTWYVNEISWVIMSLKIHTYTL